MPMPSIHNDGSARTDTEQPSDYPHQLAVSTVARPFEAAAFWSAIALPFLYLPLLISGLGSSAQLTAFLVLLALHVVTIVGGHGYNRT
jgi:hypothetical protein